MNNIDSQPKTWLLLRGLGRGSHHWASFPDLLQQKAPKDKVILLDLPGNGKLHGNDSPTSIQQMTEHYRKEVNDKTPISLIALSLGGMIAIDWMERYPNEVQCAHVINSSNGAFSRPFSRFNPQALLPLMKGKIKGIQNAEEAIIRQTCNLVDVKKVSPTFTQEAKRHPVSGANMLRQILAARRFSQRHMSHPKKLHLICADKDRLVSPACSRAMALYWNVPLSIHPSAGHDLPLDDPDWLIDVILSHDSNC